ncbi:MAG: hypothetical protein NTY60_11825 [Proteobacteria bacterium]|nr:hypothetical protein [Pseudomonadota bacterium]
MKINKKFLAIMVLAALPLASSQAGWMQSEGDIAISSGIGFKDNGNFFDRQGSSMRNTCGSGINIPLYAEYGASYYNTVYASTSLDSFNCGNVKQQGINDIETGIRGRMGYFIDHNWEVAAIFPQHLTVTGAAAIPKQFGLKAGIHSSTRLDPYESFLTEQEIAKNSFAYGAGVKYWIGDVPGELWGYMSYGHTLKNADWSKELGGWSFTARLDARNSLGKTRTVTPGNALVDIHDNYSLLTGQIGVNRSLSITESMNIFLEQGLWGRNTSYVTGAFVTYSKVWRN